MTDKQLRNFWAKVAVTSLYGCWEWTAARNTSGYGHFWLGGKMVLAHRVAYRLARGAFPEQDCSHLCHNRGCVNPLHLVDESRKANMGRTDCTGEANGRAKLSAEDVADIRRRYAAGGVFQRELAAEYGVRRATIRNIVCGKTWKAR